MCGVATFNLDSEVWGIVLVLDSWGFSWGFGAEKRPRSLRLLIFFHHFGREICRILEDEHEQDFSISAFRINDATPHAPDRQDAYATLLAPSQRPVAVF